MSNLRRVVVVGGSVAGLASAETLRRSGFDGAVTVIGDELLLPYDRPPLSKHVLSGSWETNRLALRSPEQYTDLGVEWMLGSRAVRLDLRNRAVTLADERVVPFDGLIIATGVRPRRLPETQGVNAVHVLRTIDDAVGLRDRLAPGRRLVVIGAGFLGAEVAAVAVQAGAEVTMVEPAAVPLAHAVGGEVGRMLIGLHEQNGVRVLTGTGVVGVEITGGVVSGVRLDTGEVVPGDDVLIAIGSHPNVEWLAGSGLLLDDGVVTDQFAAAAPGVYAAGDVARWVNPRFGCSMRIEHRTHAAEHGIAAARNLLNGSDPTPFAPVPYFWSEQYDVKLHAHGYLRGHDEVAVVEGSLADRSFVVAYRTGNRIAGIVGVGVSPKVLRSWRGAIVSGASWTAALAEFGTKKVEYASC